MVLKKSKNRKSLYIPPAINSSPNGPAKLPVIPLNPNISLPLKN